MTVQVEVRIGDGSNKPEIIRHADGTYSVIAKLRQPFNVHQRAVWVRTFDEAHPFMCKPLDGKGFLVNLTGKLSKG